MNKTLKIVLQTVLTIGVVVLGYLVYESIMEPVRFEKKVNARSERVVQNLKDIRSAERAYKGIYDEYTGSFDTLINFIKTGKIPVVFTIQDPEDTTFTKVITDTIDFVNVGDSLFKNRENYNVNNIRYIPFSGKSEFELAADTIKKGGVVVDVVEVKAHYNEYLKGLNEQLVINKIKSRKDIEKYPGLKFGSLKEPSTDGNWE
ncbi:MAG: hypothetical protein U5L09_08195 [Bacteroidales bacterium]|nr:hypothetical protein [Bacteroidales bacterium]